MKNKRPTDNLNQPHTTLTEERDAKKGKSETPAGLYPPGMVGTLSYYYSPMNNNPSSIVNPEGEEKEEELKLNNSFNLQNYS